MEEIWMFLMIRNWQSRGVRLGWADLPAGRIVVKLIFGISGGVAQRLEQRLHKPRVAGSIPAAAIFCKVFAERELSVPFNG
jgi:hypothetical protein